MKKSHEKNLQRGPLTRVRVPSLSESPDLWHPLDAPSSWDVSLLGIRVYILVKKNKNKQIATSSSPPPLKKNNPSTLHVNITYPHHPHVSEPFVWAWEVPGDSASEASLPLAAVPRPSASHQWHQQFVASFPSSFCEKSPKIGFPPILNGIFVQKFSFEKVERFNGSLFNGKRLERIIQRFTKNRNSM